MYSCCCRWYRCFVVIWLTLAAFGAASGIVRAQSPGSFGAPRQTNPLEKSLRSAALQLAAASLSDSNGGMATLLRLPQHVLVLPLRVERNVSGGFVPFPMGEATLRARFADLLTGVRHGDDYVIVPLSAKDTSKIIRLTPSGIARGDKPETKVLDAARKVRADCILYGTLSPPAPGSRDAVWLVNWLLLSVGNGGKETPLIKASVVTALTFDNGVQR